MENTARFNAALVVPTGIGADIGGHAGDATPVAGLLASACDTLITHPNVVNASDVIDLPRNALYVEGSVLSRLLMGTVGLQPVRGNRLLVVVDAHPDVLFTHAAVNAVSAAQGLLRLVGRRGSRGHSPRGDGLAVHVDGPGDGPRRRARRAAADAGRRGAAPTTPSRFRP